jgi:hypothetical protein
MNMDMNQNFDLKSTWVLWFHKVNDNNWNLESYSKIFIIKKYYDIIYILKKIDNITSGMFFLMKEGIIPIFEDKNNLNGGYWSLRIAKKDSFEYWEKIIYYLCIESIVIDNKYEQYINGFSVSPKINNCIFKIWTSDYNVMKTEYLKKNLEFINWEETFYLQHNGD